MNCDECKLQISLFMDNELEETQAALVREHLARCGDCAAVCEDLASILDVCSTGSAEDITPPNSQAMWCRITNIIESESKPEPPKVEIPSRRFWQMTFAQLSVAVVAIAIVSSLATLVAIRSYSGPPDADFTTRSAATQTTFERVLSKVGLIDTPQQARERRLKEQHAAIEYWTARVQNRRSQWDRTTREAFDRNLQVIEESLNEYTQILQQDPEDELSGEMLDTVLDEKMNLLRDFSDL